VACPIDTTAIEFAVTLPAAETWSYQEMSEGNQKSQRDAQTSAMLRLVTPKWERLQTDIAHASCGFPLVA